MTRYSSIVTVLVGVLVIVTAGLAGGLATRTTHRRAVNANVARAGQSTPEEKYEADKIESDYREAITTVEDKYAGEVDYEKATQAAIQGMLFTLDPHSVYFPSAEFKKLRPSTSRKYRRILEKFRAEHGTRPA